MSLKFLKDRPFLFLIVSTGILLSSTVATAAEKVVLKYSVIRMTVPVSELETFIETGQLSPSLEMLFGEAKKNPERVRRSLKEPIQVSPRFLDQALNSTPGELILEQVGEVIQPPSGENNPQALRSALVLSAQEDGEITLLETIKNYPTEEVHVEGDRLVEAYGRIAALAEQLGGATERLQELLNKIRLPRL